MIVEPLIVECDLSGIDQLLDIGIGISAVDIFARACRHDSRVGEAGINERIDKCIRPLNVFRCRICDDRCAVIGGCTEVHQVRAFGTVAVDEIRIPDSIRCPDRKSADAVAEVFTCPGKCLFQIAGEIAEDLVILPRIAVCEGSPALQILRFCRFDMRAENIICRSNGDISTYYIKHDVIDPNDPFATPKTDKFEWRKIELRTIDVME